jgi:hypothetical protein
MTNPYLKDPKQRETLLKRSVISSATIEDIYVKFHNSKAITIVQQKVEGK